MHSTGSWSSGTSFPLNLTPRGEEIHVAAFTVPQNEHLTGSILGMSLDHCQLLPKQWLGEFGRGAGSSWASFRFKWGCRKLGTVWQKDSRLFIIRDVLAQG